MKDILNIMKEAVNNKSAKILTIDLAINLKGKKIATIFFGYNSQDVVKIFNVGAICSEYTLASNESHEKFGSRAKWWDSFMSAEQIEKLKNTFHILTDDGNPTHIIALPENDGAFSCSDSDRFVFFIELNNDEKN